MIRNLSCVQSNSRVASFDTAQPSNNKYANSPSPSFFYTPLEYFSYDVFLEFRVLFIIDSLRPSLASRRQPYVLTPLWSFNSINTQTSLSKRFPQVTYPYTSYVRR